MIREKNQKRFLAACALFTLGVLVAAPLIGIENISPGAVLSRARGGADFQLFWQLRFPRVLIALLAGAGLALSGMAFQALFRNPMATPFTLGVSSGASLGAALYVTAGLSFSLLGVSGISLAAFAGSILAIAFVYGFTRMSRSFSTGTMLLAGIAASFFFSSVILFLQYVSDFTQSFLILRWLMGGLGVVGYRSVFDVLPFVVSGGAITVALTHELNLLVSGEEIAVSRGVNVVRVRQMVFFAASLMVGGIVAVAGPIGFVGMMIPHICRLIVGPDHRRLIPATLLLGGSFLALCDTVARTLIAPAEIPVGVITGLLGGPFFVWLLLRHREDGLLF